MARPVYGLENWIIEPTVCWFGHTHTHTLATVVVGSRSSNIHSRNATRFKFDRSYAKLLFSYFAQLVLLSY